MSKIVHKNHKGIERCKNVILECIFWSNVNFDTINTVENCESCMKYGNNNS